MTDKAFHDLQRRLIRLSVDPYLAAAHERSRLARRAKRLAKLRQRRPRTRFIATTKGDDT